MPNAVAVLSGGLSLERDVSLRSGRRVAEALAGVGHEVTNLDLDPELVRTLAEGSFDVAFLTLHGKAGEDGTIQGLLDLLDLPYTGPGAVASALAWDKNVCKGLWRRQGLPTPDWVAISSDAIRDMGASIALHRIIDRLGLPLVVKPSQGGAAMGVRAVHRAEDLPGALLAALSYHDLVLAEQYVTGTEVAVSVVDGEALPAVEICPKDGPYDFSARYTHGATEFFVPARLDAAVANTTARTALEAYRTVGCQRLTRADMIVDVSGTPWLLELDTCPGMTETSLLPLAASGNDWDFPTLCDRLVRSALARHDA
jgi:D-alanine-D-alanine ligase